MKIEQNGITVIFDEPNTLLEAMTDEAKIELIESLSCHEAVIKHVADQLIHGCTENGHSGSKVFAWDDDYATQNAKNRIAESSDRIAQDRIKELECYMENADKRILELNDELYQKTYYLGT
jgi:hypothetical protein